MLAGHNHKHCGHDAHERHNQRLPEPLAGHHEHDDDDEGNTGERNSPAGVRESPNDQAWKCCRMFQAVVSSLCSYCSLVLNCLFDVCSGHTLVPSEIRPATFEHHRWMMKPPDEPAPDALLPPLGSVPADSAPATARRSTRTGRTTSAIARRRSSFRSLQNPRMTCRMMNLLRPADRRSVGPIHLNRQILQHRPMCRRQRSRRSTLLPPPRRRQPGPMTHLPPFQLHHRQPQLRLRRQQLPRQQRQLRRPRPLQRHRCAATTAAPAATVAAPARAAPPLNPPAPLAAIGMRNFISAGNANAATTMIAIPIIAATAASPISPAPAPLESSPSGVAKNQRPSA